MMYVMCAALFGVSMSRVVTVEAVLLCSRPCDAICIVISFVDGQNNVVLMFVHHILFGGPLLSDVSMAKKSVSMCVVVV